MPGNQPLHNSTDLYEISSEVHEASFADDVLMDPAIEFISEMLTDKKMEDEKCMEQECLSYQAILHRVPADGSCMYAPCSAESQKYNPVHEEEDYGWIDNVLVADPFTGLDATSERIRQVESWNDFHQQNNGLKAWSHPLDSLGFYRSDTDSSIYLDSSSSSFPLHEGSRTKIADRSLTPPHAALTLPSVNHIPVQTSVSSNPFSNILGTMDATLPNGGLIFGESHALQNPSKSWGFEISQISSSEPVKTVHSQKGQCVTDRNESSEVTKQAEPIRGSDESDISFVQNEYLNAEKHAKMYGDWWPSKESRRVTKKRSNGKRKENSESTVDLRALLVECAQAIGANNLKKAYEIVQDLQQHASTVGTSSQRLAYYFTEGIMARLSSTGPQRYTAMSTNRPSAAIMLKGFRVILENCPFAKIAHFFANQNILKISEGASRLHIVDYGILYGVQWPALISALAERKGGPPSLRISGIEFPHPGPNPSMRVEETGRRLAEYARTYKVPFEYKPIAKNWEDVEAGDLDLQEGEVLVVNSVNRLRHLMDETVVNPSPRRLVLNRMRSLNPDIVVIAITNAGYNAPFFVSRFREALYHYSSKLDLIETALAGADEPLRVMLEREVIGRDILNVVACEGHERVERPETYRQWQARFERSGFKPVPLDPIVLKKATDVVKAFYHKDFSVDDDSKWMLMGWKGRIMEAHSAWKPIPCVA
ncbi:hypothetical protein KP509_01G080800 [Ceratopteris richardii]|nr:hypothetical protein KP509_01G080800 [Ceratopteris richardii]